MSKYKIIIPVGMKPGPTDYERDIAEKMALKFKTNVEFIKATSSTTPDIKILKQNRL